MAASLTGPYSEWSDAVNGFKLWESTLNAAGGISIRDINGTVYKYNVKLVVRDDASTAAGHAAAVTQLLNTDQVHFVLGASPVFAESETIAVQAAGRLNFQCCAGAATIYARDQKNVFGMSVDNALFTQELFTEYRSNNVYKIAVVYREDIQELASQCQGVIAQAKSQLLTVTLELKYSNGTNATLSALADQITAAPEEALIMCGLASESSDMIRAIDARRKPLKSIVMTGGAYTRDWNDALGELSVSVTSLAHWSPDLPRKDDFWGDAPTYAGKYKSVYQKDATQWAAAASATGYVLHTTLAGIFRRCTLSPAAAANPTTLFFTQDAINCADNNNRGHDRLIAALPLTNMDSVYGTVSFNRFRQNQGYDPVTLQTYEVTENLKLAFKPSLVLPLLSATRPLLLPQANRYIEICQPGTFRGPDAFVPCTECPAGQFQEFSGKTNCELCPKVRHGKRA
ncbi:hypothetical protein HYH02_006329 [Chlamydomonas schloesseri]|uniref:Receptor ligand binding region domain-containing protein n=1 Tax=Chlamydomonas schloesseri TaxID=2026947 RepID=A0A835WIZ6_9CHLO|nr:hypothetical protein HYH02_006329 [Chlamydomonas schloesseri]|eukprot:KAG2448437.1 hypothetical protein HYH02_006329 [Chlamydomonas schloesseri]